MPPAVAAQNISVGHCRGEACGDMLEAMARIAPRSQMATVVNNKILLDPT